MYVLRKENTREWVGRTKHHAPKLREIAKIMSDICNNVCGVMAMKSRFRIYTHKRTYLIRPLRTKKEGYVGIEIKYYGEQKSVKLKIIE